MSDRWKIVGRGKSGWHAENDSCSLSGAYAGNDGDRLALNAIDGALAYDADGADANEFIQFVMSGPIVNTALEPDTISRFSEADRHTALKMLPLMQGAFRTYILAAQRPECKALDRVGVGVFEALLREVSGMRIGHVLGGKIVWEG